MKKILGLLLTLLIVLSVTACGQDTEKTSNEKEVQDVTMLLSGIGGELATINSLGELPEPQVNGQLLFYNTKEIDGYFSGFNLGIELAQDQKTVTQIYIQPYGENQIKVNGFIIGCTVTETNTLFGNGELDSAEQNGEIFTYMNYQDENYNIKCTIDDSHVTAVGFTKIESQNVEDNEEEITEITETTETTETTEIDNQNEDNEDAEETDTKDEEELKPIELSLWMTKDDIIKVLGDDYTFETEFIGGHVDYMSYLRYDGIEFTFYQNAEELPSDQTISSVTITSNQYTFNYDIKIGDSAREVIEYCVNKFDRTYNRHGVGESYFIHVFDYCEEGKSSQWPPSISFSYSDDQFDAYFCASIEDFPEDLTIQSIRIGYALD